jgi:HEAT repeat protein
MRTISVRAGLLAVLAILACGAAVFTLQEEFWPDDSLDGQLRRLEGGWVSERRSAATGLAGFSMAPEKAVPALARALEDPDPEVRKNTLVSLGAFGEKSRPAAAAVRQLLGRTPDGTIRKQAIALLGQVKDGDSTPILIEALDDPDPGIRAEAARSLGQLGRGVASKELIDKLRALLGESRSEDLRLAGLGALRSLAGDDELVARTIAASATEDPSFEVRKTAVNLLMPNFEFVVPALAAALDDPNPQVRLAAGNKLAWVGVTDDRVVPALCRAAIKADAVTREGIGMIFSQLALDRPEGSRSRTPPTREQLERRYLSAVRELRHVLETRDAAARLEIIAVLGRIIADYEKTGKPPMFKPAKAAVEAVLSRMADEGEQLPVRLHAVNQWAVIRPPAQARSRPRNAATTGPGDGDPNEELHSATSWIEALGKLIKSSTPEIRSRAVEILVASLNEKQADAQFRDAWRKLVPVLIEGTRSEDAKVRHGSLTALSQLGPEAAPALAPLRSLARETRDPPVRAAADGVIASISSAEHLKAVDAAARIAACESLAGLGWRAEQALPALFTTLGDPDVKVRLAALAALRSLGSTDGSTVPVLTKALGAESDPPVRAAMLEALEAVAPGSRPVLEAHMGGLRDPDLRVRAAAARFRKVPADDSLVSALSATLGDPSEEVRLAAARSLAEILFASPTVLPTFVKALGDATRRPAVVRALYEHFEKVSDRAELGRVRGDLARLRSTLDLAIPALKDAPGLGDEEVRAWTYALLGRILSFSGMVRDAGLRTAIEPALDPYLLGLEAADADIRQDVLNRLGSIAVRRVEIASALLKQLRRTDLSGEDQRSVNAAMAAQAAFADSDPVLREALKPAVPFLVNDLGSTETDVKQAAIAALGHLGPEAGAAEGALRRLAAADPQPEIRRGAESALKAIRGQAGMSPARLEGPQSSNIQLSR